MRPASSHVPGASLSKRKGQRKRRRKASKKHAPPAAPRSPAGILASLAALLNAAEDAGSPLRAWHGGILFCESGFLLPPVKRGKHWEIRPLRQDPLGAPWDPDEDDG